MTRRYDGDTKHWDTDYCQHLIEEQKYHETISYLEKLSPELQKSYQACYFFGKAFEGQGNLQEALRYYHLASDSSPNDVSVLKSLGLTYLDLGRMDQAVLYLSQANRIAPDEPKILNNLGLAFLNQGNLEVAHEYFSAAVSEQADLAEAWNNLGIVARQKREMERAEYYFRRSLNLCPYQENAVTNYSLILRDLERIDEGINYLRNAVQTLPESLAAKVSLATLLCASGVCTEAEHLVRNVLEIDPKNISALLALGEVMRARQESSSAYDCYAKVLDLEETNPEARLAVAELDLIHGRYQQGWLNYEYRLNIFDSPKRLWPSPVWVSGSLTGKTILVYVEQGLGDILMFASCLPDVINLASHCIIISYKRLTTLLQRSFPSTTVVSEHDYTENERTKNACVHDLHIPIGSLPKFFRNKFEDFPLHKGYLKANPERVAFWKDRLLQDGTKLKIGIAWEGGLARTGKFYRSTDLEEWLPVLRIPNVSWISLQHTADKQLISQFAKQIVIHHWQEALDDYDETAALVAGVDLVITVCSSLAHLTGALGKVGWVLVPVNPGWRYLKVGETMPWYPSIRLFRQTEQCDWQPVFERIGKEIQSTFFKKNQ